MRTGNVSCVWESSPSYYRLLTDLFRMNVDYWSRKYDVSCHDHRPLIQRLTFTDCVLIVILTSVIAFLHVHGRRYLVNVSHLVCLPVVWCVIPVSLIWIVNLQKYEQVFACSPDKSRRAAEVTCKLAVRMIAITLCAYVTLVLPQCSILVMPSVYSTFSNHEPYSSWYQTAFAFGSATYCWEIVALFFVYERRKDFHLLLVHHMATIFCLLSGYSLKEYEIGMIILLLHDLCDPFLEVSKIAFSLAEDRSGKVDRRLVRVTDVATPLLLLTWISTRLYLFPLRCIWPVSRINRSCDFVHVYWVTMLLTVIFFLNVIWSGMIVRALYNRLKFGLFTDETIEDPDPIALQQKTSSITLNHKDEWKAVRKEQAVTQEQAFL